MIFRSLTHLRGCRSNSTEAMPLIDFVTLWFRKPRVVIMHRSNDSCFRGKKHTDLMPLESCGAEIDNGTMVAHEHTAERFLVSFSSIVRLS